MELIQQFDLLASSLGGVAKLRELILSLAVRGKLVPQDPADEPASMLLQKIRAEKERLIAEGKIKKDKQLPPISDEEKPFELPEGWEWSRFSSVILASDAGWSPSCESTPRSGSQWGVLKISAVTWGEFNPEENKALPPHLEPRTEYEVQKGDFLLSRANTEELVARSVVAWNPPPRLMLSDKLIRLKLSPLMDKKLCCFINNSAISRAHYIANASGTSSSMKNISREVILSLPVPVPPQSEQARIVAKVDELMALCDRLEAEQGQAARVQGHWVEAALEQLADSADADEFARHWQHLALHFDTLFTTPDSITQLEATLLQLAVRGKLVPQDPSDEPASTLLQKIRAEKDRLIAEGKIKKDKPLPPISDEEKPFALPEGWEWTRLPELAQFIDYRGKTPDKKNHGIPLITAKNVRKGFISREPREFISEEDYPKWMTRGFPKIGDILFTTEAPLGNVAAVDIYEPFALAQRVICLGLYLPDLSLLLKRIMLSQYFQHAILDQSSGVTAQGIKSSRLQLIPIPLPPFTEQSRIVAILEALFALTANLKAQLAKAQHTQALLADVLLETSI